MSKYYIGLDGGSTYLKAAMLSDGKVLDTLVRNTGIDNNGTAKKLVQELCDRNHITQRDIGYIMATGYSRKVLEVADDDISPRSLPMPTGSGLRPPGSTVPA